MANSYVGYENVAMVLSPQDIGATDTASLYVNLKTAQSLAFLVSIGAITTATATDTLVVTVECATAADGTEAAVAFYYRLAGVNSTDAGTWGAVTSADTTGYEYASTADNKALWIEVDPAALAASDYVLARVKISSPADMTNAYACVHAIYEARYKQTTFISSTASASS